MLPVVLKGSKPPSPVPLKGLPPPPIGLAVCNVTVTQQPVSAGEPLAGEEELRDNTKALKLVDWGLKLPLQ
jgi:hypothetical protein